MTVTALLLRFIAIPHQYRDRFPAGLHRRSEPLCVNSLIYLYSHTVARRCPLTKSSKIAILKSRHCTK